MHAINKTDRVRTQSLRLWVQQVGSMYTVPSAGAVGTSGRGSRGGKVFLHCHSLLPKATTAQRFLRESCVFGQVRGSSYINKVLLHWDYFLGSCHTLCSLIKKKARKSIDFYSLFVKHRRIKWILYWSTADSFNEGYHSFRVFIWNLCEAAGVKKWASTIQLDYCIKNILQSITQLSYQRKK